MYFRVTALREGDQRTVRKLSRRIRVGLRTDRKRQVEEAGRTIEYLLVSDPSLCKRGLGPDVGVVQICG